jgi:hypothetical protein
MDFTKVHINILVQRFNWRLFSLAEPTTGDKQFCCSSGAAQFKNTAIYITYGDQRRFV